MCDAWGNKTSLLLGLRTLGYKSSAFTIQTSCLTHLLLRKLNSERHRGRDRKGDPCPQSRTQGVEGEAGHRLGGRGSPAAQGQAGLGGWTMMLRNEGVVWTFRRHTDSSRAHRATRGLALRLHFLQVATLIVCTRVFS